MIPDPTTTTASEFLTAIWEAITQERELLVLCRHANMGGNAYYWWLIHTEDEMRAILASAPFQASISVFLETELPLRGIANPTLLQGAQDLLVEEGEILMAQLPEYGSFLENTSYTDDASDVVSWFEDNQGVSVAIGRFPDFCLRNDSGIVITGYVPDANGTLIIGSF